MPSPLQRLIRASEEPGNPPDTNSFTLQIEHFIPVSGYIKEGDYNNQVAVARAFEIVQDKLLLHIPTYLWDHLIGLGEYELADWLHFSDIRFIEFDSTNPSHAVGYFDVTITGPKRLEAQTRKAFSELIIEDPTD